MSAPSGSHPCARVGCTMNGRPHARRSHIWEGKEGKCRTWAGDTGTPVPCRCAGFIPAAGVPA